ncbi:MAG: agmatine deiminase family protein [Bacteroidales bacterium]|nr:agmatine deiminase family protein [Bacteroidales bacterium]MBN2763939.1 agmatine deiminase family protein [Bacteroidales bacterium]
MIQQSDTPAKLGYRFPAEWEKHASTWLSYPHNESSWPGKINTIFPYYHEFIKQLSRGEKVNINVVDELMKNRVNEVLQKTGISPERYTLHIHPTNDAWCRDHGPTFLVNPAAYVPKVIVNWRYNGWGGKYPANLDTHIPTHIANLMGLPVFYPGIVMEGGSIDVNGRGTLITTTSCLLNPNRNPGISKSKIEEFLMQYYCVEKVLWLGDGIEGDDTDGHIDDLTRFINEDTVITMTESNRADPNYNPLKKNLEKLKKMRMANGKQMNIVELPMPEPVYYEGQRLPASYANFYMANAGVIVPVFRCQQDDTALNILSEHIKDKPVLGIDSTEIIWGLGSWHCLSQQEPA